MKKVQLSDQIISEIASRAEHLSLDAFLELANRKIKFIGLFALLCFMSFIIILDAHHWTICTKARVTFLVPPGHQLELCKGNLFCVNSNTHATVANFLTQSNPTIKAYPSAIALDICTPSNQLTFQKALFALNEAAKKTVGEYYKAENELLAAKQNLEGSAARWINEGYNLSSYRFTTAVSRNIEVISVTVLENYDHKDRYTRPIKAALITILCIIGVLFGTQLVNAIKQR